MATTPQDFFRSAANFPVGSAEFKSDLLKGLNKLAEQVQYSLADLEQRVSRLEEATRIH